KPNPLQVLHGLQFALSQSQTHYWIHRLLPVLQHALRAMGQAPEREAQRVETSAAALAGAPNLAVDGTERRRQRPRDAATQKAHYSGKKKTHTDKNILLINAHTGKVVYLGPTLPGKTHDKKAVGETPVPYRPNTTLDKDTGFQGYEPGGVLTTQPKKSPKGKSSREGKSSATGSHPRYGRWSHTYAPSSQKKAQRERAHGRGKVLQPDLLQCTGGGRTRDRWGQTVSDSQRCF